jgi:hypothetical protein
MGQNLKGVPVQRMSYTIIGEYRTDNAVFDQGWDLTASSSFTFMTF